MMSKVNSLKNVSLKNSIKLPSIEKRSTKNTSLSKQNSSSSASKFDRKKYKLGMPTEPRDEITTTNMSQSSSYSPQKMVFDL